MRREITEIKEIVKKENVIVSKSVTCNKCGASSVLNKDGDWYATEEGLYANDKHNFSLGFGYGSKFDMESWSFDLCDLCLEDLVKTFKYPPDGFMEDGYSYIGNEEEKQKVFEHYKATGDWNELKFKTYEELKELANYYELDYINEIVKENYPDKPLFSHEE